MILLTGATGFIGPKIAHELRSRDLPVRALVRDPAKSGSSRRWGVELAQGDMTGPDTLRAPSRAATPSSTSSRSGPGKPQQFEAIMAQGTRDLVSAAQEAGVGRWIQMSALGVARRRRT